MKVEQSEAEEDKISAQFLPSFFFPNFPMAEEVLSPRESKSSLTLVQTSTKIVSSPSPKSPFKQSAGSDRGWARCNHRQLNRQRNFFRYSFQYLTTIPFFIICFGLHTFRLLITNCRNGQNLHIHI